MFSLNLAVKQVRSREPASVLGQGWQTGFEEGSSTRQLKFQEPITLEFLAKIWEPQSGIERNTLDSKTK